MCERSTAKNDARKNDESRSRRDRGYGRRIGRATTPRIDVARASHDERSRAGIARVAGRAPRTHRRRRVYFDARRGAKSRARAPRADARSDGINTSGRPGPRKRRGRSWRSTTTTTTGANARERARGDRSRELGEREFLDDLVRGDARTARKRGRKSADIKDADARGRLARRREGRTREARRRGATRSARTDDDAIDGDGSIER